MTSRVSLLLISVILFWLSLISIPTLAAHRRQDELFHEEEEEEMGGEGLITSQPEKWQGRVIKVEGGPESVIWVVQLSDLHFSVHHPDRAFDFRNIVGPALSMINPSLVLITGDLTDGKSKDLLTMKQNEGDWLEYQNVMEDVIKRSGLDKSIFFDLRGNHDNFGVPLVGGSFDFFSKYSINGQLGRRKNVNSITLETAERRHLFIGLDSTSRTGVRGPTNLFGHPTDELLSQIDIQLSQWDSQSEKPVTKIAFGHFPLSFSAISHSRKSLKDVFLKHSVSAYLCGHLHTKFGKNLKRLHMSDQKYLFSQLFQLNIHQFPSQRTVNCSLGAPVPKEFWEWEMGDWRKSRAMRITTVDRGHVSYVDIDLKSETKKTIVLPTFPLDSRFMSTFSGHQSYECQHKILSSFGTVRTLVFSVSPIMSVIARIYDTRPGTSDLVMETPMTKLVGEKTRGDLYAAPWNYQAFGDSSPDRFWLEVEAIDIMGRSTLSEPRPFSINGLTVKISWTWKEFFVMGCQWSALYYPILWIVIYSTILILLIPKVIPIFSVRQYSYKSFINEKGFLRGVAWVLQDLCRITMVWLGTLGYVIYLILCPWFIGQVFTDGEDRGYMTYMGWVIKTSKNSGKHEYIGFPDIMVVVLPHLLFVVLPTIFVTAALAAERSVYKEHFLLLSGKKEDDDCSHNRKRPLVHGVQEGGRPKFHFRERWIRTLLLLVCLAICWKHFNNCWGLMKAYEMNLFLDFPVYGLSIPLLLAYTVYKTRSIQ
ncbi:hypothetical protein K2173_011807 [Erythroxylum novogranatense]|uniref:Calcineurin-like phosphoesterase domain-containing protein n=1 Tax=Erythroxylum novogranatense TaxID=1862640 RepID=A0AAV8SLZ3_9ROSI|nr:hypothetical protein K2173_011807 [Erythroxylum novogranatense]